MFALQDGNNFYASCERVFSVRLRGVPVIVASNNDGCAVARSQEAKALGVRMGQPVHELKQLIRSHGLQVRSANFSLYGDISHRIAEILRAEVPRLEIYSIDENFCDVTGIRNREAFAHRLREKVLRWTGIPSCIGIGPTKTLAKLANKAAKSGAGVIDLADQGVRDRCLETFPIADIWGVGPRYAARLTSMDIHTAAHLRDAPTDVILKEFGVVLTRTQRELQGHPCIELADVEPDRKQIVVSRSFGERVTDHAAVGQALATFAVRAAEKLRRRGLVAAGVGFFVHSDVFRPELPQHNASRSVSLPTATSDSRLLAGMVQQLTRGRLKEGIGYKKAGVVLMDLARPENLQADLFAPAISGNPKLMSALDAVNAKFGRGTAGLGATGWAKRPDWQMRQKSLSPCYTTRLSDLPRAEC